MADTLVPLRCKAQNYDWGIRGPSSSVGRLYALGSSTAPASLPAEMPFAELWMGTHPSGPSAVSLTSAAEPSSSGSGSVLLKDWLSDNPAALGDKVAGKWDGQLPFLFKVLSVAKALSIQAHPDKALAEQLHARDPKNYKDDNHKPEMALAVTNFEALCGFVTTEELATRIAAYPELRQAIGDSESAALLAAVAADEEGRRTEAFQAAFRSLMTQDSQVVSSSLTALVARLKEEEAKSLPLSLSPTDSLILRTEQQYPNDVGVFAIFFLNHLTLKPGQAIYLAANEPHAYLAGECIECMAASDNVVRAGLTPKFRDTDTLCSMLTYKQGPPDILPGTPLDSFTTTYTPPFDEFEVDKVLVPLGQTAPLSALPGPSILLVFRGSGAASVDSKPGFVQGVGVGDIFFVPAGVGLKLGAVVEAGGESEPLLEVYRARVNQKALA